MKINSFLEVWNYHYRQTAILGLGAMCSVKNMARTFSFSLGVRIVCKRVTTGLQIRVRVRKLFFLFLSQNICCGYSKEPSQ